jgi:hypothetical protein
MVNFVNETDISTIVLDDGSKSSKPGRKGQAIKGSRVSIPEKNPKKPKRKPRKK